jgi:hypothetical protein
VIFINGILLSRNDLSYYGYYTDKVVNWVWLGSTIMFIISFWRWRTIRVYFALLLTLLCLSILPMGIPFFGIVHYFTTIGDHQQISLGEGYRIERTRHQPLSLQRLYIYERRGILEKNIGRPVYTDILESVIGIEPFKGTREDERLSIQSAKLITLNEDSIGIEYQISDRKRIVYHPLQHKDGY